MGVFWGVAVIGFSGLVLWMPTLATTFLPGWVLNAAYVIHSDEALLATGFIFLFHFFHTHLRPEAFPMDTVVFTGRMPLEAFKEERPLEYERLVAQGKLDALHGAGADRRPNACAPTSSASPPGRSASCWRCSSSGRCWAACCTDTVSRSIA